MTQIDDLQARISRALDRIGYGLETFEPGAGSGETEALSARVAELETAQAAAEARANAAEAAAEAIRAQLQADMEQAVETALNEAAAGQEIAVAEAVEVALSRAAEERDRALAAIRAEAEAAIASHGSVGEADAPSTPAVPSADWARVEDELRTLREALEDERIANAQLTERMRHLKERIPQAAAAPSGPQSIAALDAEVQRLRAANAQLAEANGKLREANAMGVGDTQLINKALAAELEAMRASRSVDAAETQALIEVLEPLLAEAGVTEEAGA
ncbi:hypothetical protein [Sagittula salina]|uniref:Colicin transporter n=1 Tax=Sagittula salina TaxID=2820268 RepID=A0A940RZH2_9RHOB|nr:hypothetical protein [Sagittula salina]MBP0481983.1 hypothetical protein [Sagittula salina]